MTLPWADTTVIGQVVKTISAAGVAEIVVVTGGAHQAVEAALHGFPARLLYNPHYADDEMARSVQIGLGALNNDIEAALIALGDQPQLEIAVVKGVIAAYYEENTSVVVPSYQRRRGHPWLVARSLWPMLMDLKPPETLRDFLEVIREDTYFLEVDTDTILQDLDTPDDYKRYRAT